MIKGINKLTSRVSNWSALGDPYPHESERMAALKSDPSNKKDGFLRKAQVPLLEKTVEICKRSALHGLPGIFSKETFRVLKVLWIICIFLSWGYFIYQTYYSIKLYQSFPKVTRISKANEPLVEFPGKIFFLKKIN